MDQRHAISELIYATCTTLDDKQFNAYLELCDPAFHYAITAYGPEIRKDMIWLEHDKAGMQTLFNNLPRHNSDHSPLTRHATVYSVKTDESGQRAEVVSALQIFRTALDGGATELFAVGKMHDKVTLEGGTPKLLDRNVRLDTRMLGYGYHIPF
ncbi:MAG: nuclear transport factor 2 family protein [Proteobacteria bacterium]|nr:nuclear transport factor 2 family protein [Pseudomonadota bacterium]